MVFGADDAEVIALVDSREKLDAVVAHPSASALHRALDKLTLTRAAQRAGLTTPLTWEAAESWPQRDDEPVVVKAREHAPTSTALSRIEASVARTRKEALDIASEIRSLGGSPIFQQWVGGALEALVTVADDAHRTVVAAYQVAERINPPGIGRSARARTTVLDPDLLSRAEALLRNLNWTGMAELQFVRPAGGAPLLIDLNGRFYGSLALITGAGVNAPDIWARLATGRPVPIPGPARVGMRYQWLEGDLRRAMIERRDGLVSDIAGSLRYAVGAKHSMWSASDPLPAVAMAASLAGRAARRSYRRANDRIDSRQARRSV